MAARGLRILALLGLAGLLAAAPAHADYPPAGPPTRRPALSVETLEFLPGQGRAARSFLLYELPGAAERYLDVWDATQILQANRYFDPVTRKVSLAVAGHRIKLTDGSAWVFVDSRPRRLGAPCRIAAGSFYLPLSFWPVLLEELPDLPLRRDEKVLRLVGGLRSVNVLSVEWVFSGERLRGVFQLSEPLSPSLERVGDSVLRLRFPGGRLAPFDWQRLPARAPVDSLRLEEGDDSATLTLYFRRPVSELRSAGDPVALTWALTADVPAAPGLMAPDFAGALPERRGAAFRERRLQRILIDPAHGGADTGAVSGSQLEKDWTLRMAGWLDPHLRREGFEVFWTRRDDRERSAVARVQSANVGGGDLYLSLHFTRRGAGGEKGLEIMLEAPADPPANAEALRPWAAVQAAHAESSLELATGIEESLALLTDWPQLGIRRERTAILEGLDMPALLLEIGNLDSATERAAWEDGPTRDERLGALARVLAYRARHWRGGSR